jgi:hypothetical protein
VSATQPPPERTEAPAEPVPVADAPEPQMATSPMGVRRSPKVSHPNVSVVLTGTDGNVYALIGRVAAALRETVDGASANQFVAAAFGCTSYDDVLRLIMRTVNVR